LRQHFPVIDADLVGARIAAELREKYVGQWIICLPVLDSESSVVDRFPFWLAAQVRQSIVDIEQLGPLLLFFPTDEDRIVKERVDEMGELGREVESPRIP